MMTFALMFETAPVVLPVTLFVLLALGLWFPIYDFIQLRRKARHDGEPQPGITALLQELSKSQLLAVFLFITGIMTILLGFFGLVTRDHIDITTTITMVLIIVVGGISVFSAQLILRRFQLWSRNWRIHTQKK